MEVVNFIALRREFDTVVVKLRSSENISEKQSLTDRLAQIAARGNKATQNHAKGRRKGLDREFRAIAKELAVTSNRVEREVLIKRAAQLIDELRVFCNEQQKLLLTVREKTNLL